MLNKCTLIGNLGNNPETKDLGNGRQVCTFSVATSESWKDKQTGEKKTATEWHKVNFFSPVAEICAKYLKKGSKVYVEGSIHTRKWQDNNGQDRYSTEIKGRDMKMLGDKTQQSEQVQEYKPQAQQQAVPQSNFDDYIPY
jgi:single-strand DNA-binding protein